MKIEIAAPKSAPSKEKGDLLENLAAKLLRVQGYEVIQEIRMTAVELDLLCKHKVTKSEIYVECKGFRDNIDANILKNLAGTLMFKGYDEAWLISTGTFGKEAKGFVEEWEKKPNDQAKKLGFYTPEKTIGALIDARIISHPPQEKFNEILKSKNKFGEWLLLVTPYGEFWVGSILAGGLPNGILAFHAADNEMVMDEELLRNLAKTDTSVANLDFLMCFSLAAGEEIKPATLQSEVVEVQHGDSWSDYRPARPEDFIGRLKVQEKILSLLKSISKDETQTRIFAVTGDSGMGKSSLIAKIRDRSFNKHYKNQVFIFAVDMRAATSEEYIHGAILKCLLQAQENGFGSKSIEIRLTDLNRPLESESIREYLTSLEANAQVVCLIFDQFEELYSKPDLFAVFNKSKDLFLSCAALNSNICLGFAWKSDSTTHSEHPAYFLWHELSDLRLTIRLAPFTEGESESAIKLFESQIHQVLENDLKHSLISSSQGYPWLLKKLCIHVAEKLQTGSAQRELIENQLDVAQLFDIDLSSLSAPERGCLELIAQRAPVGWYEVIEISGPVTLNALLNKRLVVRSGDRINLYWDIFREYVLTQKVPVLPLTYLPGTDLTTILKIATRLSHQVQATIEDLSSQTGLSPNTIFNIGIDLATFGVIERENGKFRLSSNVTTVTPEGVLLCFREKFKRHAFTLALLKKPSNVIITIGDAIEVLKSVLPNRNFSTKTWRTYTIRLSRWLVQTGFLAHKGSGWICRDLGKVTPQNEAGRLAYGGRGRGKLFTAPASVASVEEALKWLLKRKSIGRKEQLPDGFRNAFTILRRFQLIVLQDDIFVPNLATISKAGGPLESIWACAGLEDSIIEARKYIESNPSITGKDIGKYMNKKYYLSWRQGSEMRNGNGVKQWADWIIEGHKNANIPPAPGRLPT